MIIMILYHGSKDIVKTPDLSHSRSDIDFGCGFYLTEDKNMAKKWVSNKNSQQYIVNQYKLDLNGLKVYHFEKTKEWLDFVASNRGYSDKKFDISDIDVLIGPTADDRLYTTLQFYSREQ